MYNCVQFYMCMCNWVEGRSFGPINQNGKLHIYLLVRLYKSMSMNVCVCVCVYVYVCVCLFMYVCICMLMHELL